MLANQVAYRSRLIAWLRQRESKDLVEVANDLKNLVDESKAEERAAAEREIVEWLRARVGVHEDEDMYSLGDLSDEIERGDYRKRP